MPAPTTAETSIAALFDAYGSAWAERDPELIASFHAPDGIFHLHAGADAIEGRDAIREAFAGFLAQFPEPTALRQLGLDGAAS